MEGMGKAFLEAKRCAALSPTCKPSSTGRLPVEATRLPVPIIVSTQVGVAPKKKDSPAPVSSPGRDSPLPPEPPHGSTKKRKALYRHQTRMVLIWCKNQTRTEVARLIPRGQGDPGLGQLLLGPLPRGYPQRPRPTLTAPRRSRP